MRTRHPRRRTDPAQQLGDRPRLAVGDHQGLAARSRAPGQAPRPARRPRCRRRWCQSAPPRCRPGPAGPPARVRPPVRPAGGRPVPRPGAAGPRRRRARVPLAARARCSAVALVRAYAPARPRRVRRSGSDADQRVTGVGDGRRGDVDEPADAGGPAGVDDHGRVPVDIGPVVVRQAGDPDPGGQMDNGVVAANCGPDRRTASATSASTSGSPSPAGRRCSTVTCVTSRGQSVGRSPHRACRCPGDQHPHSRPAAGRPAPDRPSRRRAAAVDLGVVPDVGGQPPGLQHSGHGPARRAAGRRPARRRPPGPGPPRPRHRAGRPGTTCCVPGGPTPTAAAAATSGSCSTRCSTPTGVTGPPGVLITCTSRPSTQSRPWSSRWPTSPVRCQPGSRALACSVTQSRS